MNNGQCSIVSDPTNILAYRCSCPFGFTGRNCETPIDFCANNPCMNRGWCTSGPTTFICNCLQGFTGMVTVFVNLAIAMIIMIITIGNDCSQVLQTCQSNSSACGNNGVCSNRVVLDITASYCSCYPGYAGEFCEQMTTSCVCLHRGYFCICINFILHCCNIACTELACQMLVEETFHLVAIVQIIGKDFIVKVY